MKSHELQIQEQGKSSDSPCIHFAKVEIYTSPFCGYCARAKRLLTGKGVDYIEYDVLTDPSLRDEMARRADGRTTVPQIFIDGVAVGGSDDIHQLDREGRLDAMLAGTA